MTLKKICDVLMIMNPKRFPKTHFKPCDCTKYLCKFDLRYFDVEGNKVAYCIKFNDKNVKTS
jgi:hypothetical protein